MSTSIRWLPQYSRSTNSTIFTSLLCVAALFLGWVLMNWVENRTNLLTRSGVSAMVPSGWLVQKGIEGSQTIFTTSYAMDPNLKYTVSLLPSSADMKASDVAFTLNLQRGKDLKLYRVLDQSEVKVMGKAALKVHFTYVDPKSEYMLPLVIEGVDYISLAQPKSLVVSFEEETSQYNDALPAFLRFLGTVTNSPGGSK
jgi:hypothetical protein